MKKPLFIPLKSRGFALVVTLSLMILLTMVAVGLLSLSAVSMRTSTQAKAQAEAQANARLALMIAIGELQKQMGPDQRISANGAMLDTLQADGSVQQPAKNPHWTGVWDSWIAGPVDPTTVNPSYPEKTDPTAQSAHSTIEPLSGGFPPTLKTGVMAPKYPPNSSDKGRSDYFRSWLVSLLPADAGKAASAKDLVLDGKEFPGKTDTAIRLVGSRSSSSTDYVSARLIDATSHMAGKGRYGWWVGDESQKARVLHDSYVSKPPANSAQKIFRGQSPGSTGTKNIKDLEGLTAAQDLKLDSLASMKTLDLVPADASKEPARKNFHHVTPYSSQVLADVREGGLKRDLSTILEQPIIRTNSGPEYMLYAFNDSRFPNDQSHSRVPIQDLAAYYQLYNDIKPAESGYGVNGREGVRFTSDNSNDLPNAIQTRVADLDGGTRDKQRFLREYTAQYKQPVVTKIQFLLAMSSDAITDADRAQIDNNPSISADKKIRATDSHKLRLGLMPMVTLWNPNNLPMVMDSSQLLTMFPPPFALQFRKYRDGSATGTDMRWFNLSGSTYNGPSGGNSGGYAQFILRIARQTNPKQTYVFQPGEVKVFSIPSTSGAGINADGNLITLGQETVNNTVNSWDPLGVFRIYSSSPSGPGVSQAPEVYNFSTGRRGECLVFGPNDKISLRIDTDSPEQSKLATSGLGADGRAVSKWVALKGAGFHHYMIDEQYASPWQNQEDAWRHNVMLSRHGGGSANLSLAEAAATFNRDLLLPGFPGGTAPIEFDAAANAIGGDQIIGAGNLNRFITLMEFTMSKGCEIPNAASGGLRGGRRITSRPFLHSSLTEHPFIDQNDKATMYNYGWDWSIRKVNSLQDATVTAKPGTGNGYFGGGYTIDNGTTHVIQREIPSLPPLSIASLSHAELGGFSLAYSKCMGDNPDTDTFWSKTANNRIFMPIGVDYQRVTATGQGGLGPHIQQAIGNSYAHPNIPANKAFTTVTRLFDLEEGSKVVPFVDQSYLANKALWDEFYFSSIAPQPAKIPLFGTTNPTRTAKEVADAFFKLSAPLSASPLPNRRIKAHTTNLSQSKLDTLFTQAGIYTNGLADKIAAHLMVEGAFNVNSTSVEAWKVFLSSLKGKPVAYLDGGAAPNETTPAGTVMNPGCLVNDVPVKSADISKTNTPEGQWKSGRELTDDEITQLATAMVKQVKLRGPFLSMSEFVNRRLTSAEPDGMAVKGALQAALDDPSVSINAMFRTPERLIDGETAGILFPFQNAATGPIAYGSQPYVDQADVLRGFSEQLTPRGDTFIIRTYGDSLDVAGNVIARAWCEAVVQRVPEYVDSLDEPHVKSANLVSASNRTFGRKIQITGFRWLNISEI